MLADICGFPTLSVTSEDGLPLSIVALFVIDLSTPSVNSLALTCIFNSLDSFTPKFFTVHLISGNFETSTVSPLSVYETYSTPSGSLSITTAVPTSAPLFVAVIVYSNVSPTFKYLLPTLLVFAITILGFLTVVGGFGSFSSTPFTVTVFAVSVAEVAGTSFPSLSFTVPKLSIVTSNVIVNVVFPANE